MNPNMGKVGAIVTGIVVLSFAISMIVGLFIKGTFASCFSSIFIVIGFVIFMYSIFPKEREQFCVAY